MGAYELTPGMTYDNLDVSNLSIIYGNLTTGTSNITIKGLSGGVKGQLLKIFNTADVYLNGVNIILECENQNAIQQFRSPLNSNNKKQYINSGKYLETFFDGSYWRISTMGM